MLTSLPAPSEDNLADAAVCATVVLAVVAAVFAESLALRAEPRVAAVQAAAVFASADPFVVRLVLRGGSDEPLVLRA